MRNLVAAAVSAGLGFCTVSAFAVPIAMPAPTGDASIIQIAQGCGPGGHRGPYGACRPLFNCPPGWHTGPYGVHCFRNRNFY